MFATALKDHCDSSLSAILRVIPLMMGFVLYLKSEDFLRKVAIVDTVMFTPMAISELNKVFPQGNRIF